jgi:uncharacterized protein (DUF488 family)
MFYRRKLILGLLQAFGGRLEKINLQKLLFLVCSEQTDPAYDFVPYLYGCYSYSAGADLNAMLKKGFLWEDETSYHKKDKKNYLISLSDTDRKMVNTIYLKYHNMDAEALMRHTYIHYPYYAINSTRAPQLLNAKQMEQVISERPSVQGNILYTIGYEGISLEAYLNKLIRHGIRLLIDVRNNPLSHKFGFSKTSLKKYCSALQIEYRHFPEVGIQSEFRQELKSQADYDHLFEAYKETTLSKTSVTQKAILDLLQQYQRIALTCFEANICQCHRKPLADSITKLPDWKYQLIHI